MKVAYVDTSWLLTIALEEHKSKPLIRRLMQFDERHSSNLLEAEFRSGLAREGRPAGERFLSWIDWIYVDRPLTPEIMRVLGIGDLLRGADLWHLACALVVAAEVEQVTFLTLDERQKAVARKLGFPT